MQLKTIKIRFLIFLFMFFSFKLGYMNLIQSRGSLNKYSLQFRWKSSSMFDRIDNLKIPIFLKFGDNCQFQIISLLSGSSGELNQKWFRRLKECQIVHILGNFGVLKAYIHLAQNYWNKYLLSWCEVDIKSTGTGVGSEQNHRGRGRIEIKCTQ